MEAQIDKPIIRRVLREGETINLPHGDGALREVTCNDVARMALAIHNHSNFFSRRRGIKTYFSRDLNGSGTQGLYVGRSHERISESHFISISFFPTSDHDPGFLYEADLITDQRKDYEPTVNRGKRRFKAQTAAIEIDWFGEETIQWRSDIARLSTTPDTLASWMDADLEMFVRCTKASLCSGNAIFTASDLARFIAAGLSLEDLKARLKCSKCGRRGASVSVF